MEDDVEKILVGMSRADADLVAHALEIFAKDTRNAWAAGRAALLSTGFKTARRDGQTYPGRRSDRLGEYMARGGPSWPARSP